MPFRVPPSQVDSWRRPAAFPLLRLGVLATLAALVAPEARAGVIAPICDWTGGSSVSSLWSDPANWNNCGGAHPVPADGDIVRFPAGAARRTNQNDLAGLDLLQLVFTGTNYVLTGNGVTLDGQIASNVTALAGGDAGPNLGLPIALAGNSTLTCNGNRGVQVSGAVALGVFTLGVQGSCDAELSGALSGAGALTKQGAGILTLSAAGSHDGPVQVQGGVLALRANPGTDLFDVSAGASLRVETDTTFPGALQLGGAGAPGMGSLTARDGLPNWAGPIVLSNGASIEVDGSAILTLSGPVSGSGGLTKAGVGQLVLSGTGNTYAGGTTLLVGDVLATSNGALGAAGFPVTVGEDTMLELESDVYPGRPLVLDGEGLLRVGALRSRGADVVWSGPVTLAGDAAVGGQLNTTLMLSGVVSGPGALTHAGLNELILTAANTYTGATRIAAGTLLMRNPGALGTSAAGTVVENGATLAVDGPMTVAEPLVLNGFGFGGALQMLDGDNVWTAPITLGLANTVIGTGAGSLTLAGLNGAGGLQKTGTGTLVLNTSNSYAGPTYVTDGILRLEHANALGAAGDVSNGTDMSSGATLQLAGVNVVGEALTLLGSGVGDIGGLHAAAGSNGWSGPVNLLTLSRVGVAAGSQLDIGGVISGNGSGLYKVGAGTLTLSGANTYVGTTIVFDGVLRAEHDQALGAATGLLDGGTSIGFGATLELGDGLAIGNEYLSILGEGVGSQGALLSASGANSWAGPWALIGPTRVAVSGGSLALGAGTQNAQSLTKVGPGTLTYGGATPYTGTTTVSAGVLNVLAGAAAGDVTVDSGGTLTGAGNVGDIGLNAGGTVAPAGTLGADDLLWNGGEIALRLGPTALGSDRIALAGFLHRLAAPHVMRFFDSPAGPPARGVSYALVGYTSTSFNPGEIDHSYNDVAGPNSLPGTIVVGLNELTFVPQGVSLYRDGFEAAP
jgi:fibronectin-binding autotransporter adhesin